MTVEHHPESTVLPALGRSRRPLAIAGVLVLLLALAGSYAIVRSRALDRQHLAAAHALSRADFGVRLLGVASDHRVSLVVSVGSTVPARVVSAAVEGDGWQAVTTKVHLGTEGQPAVSLSRAVDCGAAVAPPTAATAVVELEGQRRTLDLLADTSLDGMVAQAETEACGSLPATQALLLSGSTATRSGTTISMRLTMTNRSTYNVLVRQLTVPGIGVYANPKAPLLVPAQVGTGTFALSADAAQTRTIRLTLPVKGCALSPLGAPVQVHVDGKGGPGIVTLTSPSLIKIVTAVCR